MEDSREPATHSVILTDTERRNGWTAESLAAYLEERERAQADAVLRRPPAKPSTVNGRYNPLRWRK
jgi:hypothetical protein